MPWPNLRSETTAGARQPGSSQHGWFAGDRTMPPAGSHWTFLAAVMFVLLLFHPGLPAQTEPAQYVGSDACSACHEELAGSIVNSAHGRLFQEPLPARQGCEACHGPGSNHVNSGGDGTLLFSFRRASAAEIRRHCAVCHATLANEIHRRRTTCLSCHAVHHYRQKQFLLVNGSFQLCGDCHDRRIKSRGGR